MDTKACELISLRLLPEWSWVWNPGRNILKGAPLLYFAYLGINEVYKMTMKVQLLITIYFK